MIDRGMMRRLLTQCGMGAVIIDDATMKLATAIFAAGMAEEREACAGICDRFAARDMHPAECAGAIRMRSN